MKNAKPRKGCVWEQRTEEIRKKMGASVKAKPWTATATPPGRISSL